MPTYSFLMKSSSHEDVLYSVECAYDDNSVLTIRCDCMAGHMGDLCKHVKSFFEGKCPFLLYDDDVQNFTGLSVLLTRSAAHGAYQQMLNDLAAIEQNQKALNEAAKNVKLAFVRHLGGKI